MPQLAGFADGTVVFECLGASLRAENVAQQPLESLLAASLESGQKPKIEASMETGDSRREAARQELQRFWNVSRDYYLLAGEANPHPSAERRVLFDYLEGHEVVLDLGCGSCENSLWLPDGCHYVGLDVSTTGLAMAREWARPAGLLRADGIHLPLATGSADVVVSTWVVEHLHYPAETLLEAARVLRVGGLLMMVCSAWDLPYSLPPSVAWEQRLTVSVQRLVGQLRSLLDGRHRFDIVTEPLFLAESYAPDTDAVHITQSFFLCRFLRAAGLRILEHRVLPHETPVSGARRLWRRLAGRAPIWSHAWGNALIVARREEHLRSPDYELQFY